MTDIEQQARKEAEALLALVKKYRPITDECPRCDGMGCSGPCPPHYWEAPMLEGFATFISERSKPSLMVGFSEEDVRLIADGVAEDCGVDDETEDGAYTWKCMLECAMKVHEAHAANTRAVSIDRLVEVFKAFLKASGEIDHTLFTALLPEEVSAGITKYEADLRERLMKMTP